MPTAFIVSLLGHVVLVVLLTIGLPALFEAEKRQTIAASGVGVVTEAQLADLTKPPLPPAREAGRTGASEASNVAATDAARPDAAAADPAQSAAAARAEAAQAEARAADATPPTRPSEQARRPEPPQATARAADAPPPPPSTQARRPEPPQAAPRPSDPASAATARNAPPPPPPAARSAPTAESAAPAPTTATQSAPEPPRRPAEPRQAPPPSALAAAPPPEAAAPSTPQPQEPEAPRPQETVAQLPQPQRPRAKATPTPPRRPEALRQPPNQIAEAPAAPERAAPERPQPSSNDSFASMMQSAIGERSSDDGMAAVAASLGVGVAAGSISEADQNALAARLGGCWRPLRGAARAETLIVELQVDLAPTSEVESVSVIRRPSGQFGQAAVDRARQAVYQCSPFNQPGQLVLPRNGYQDWRRMRITFDPRKYAG